MAGTTLEVVMYSAKPGVSEDEMRSAVEVSNAVLRAFPGYLGRELAYASETGQWIDIVRWEDRASALAAVAAFGLQPKAQALTDVTDHQRIRFMHLESMLTDEIMRAEKYSAKEHLMQIDDRIRCSWCLVDELYMAYHDEEWGVPVHDDRELFELLMLEGFQAGLSWRTILGKRENFFRAFDGWVPETIAAYGPDEIARLMADAGIVRNRLKVEGAVKNARSYLQVVDSFGSFDQYIWQFTGGDVLKRALPATVGEIPAFTPESDAMSKDLKKRGFTFVGTTICYAFMQSAGMVNDHIAECWRSGIVSTAV